MNLTVLNKYNVNDLNSFIDFWSKLYAYPNEKKYDDALIKNKFKHNDIQDLYEWKNGMKLSGKKQASLDTKIINKLLLINNLKTQNVLNIEAFREEFKNLTTVWKIFLLHIIKPEKYPIYDQHIHRAFLYIHGEDWNNISNTSISNKVKEKFYFDRYLPFIEEQSVKDLKKLDEAFFAFGQFLNTRNFSKLL